MPERLPRRGIPVWAGMDPEPRFKLAVELAEQVLACMKHQPDEAAGMLEEGQRQLGWARRTQ